MKLNNSSKTSAFLNALVLSLITSLSLLPSVAEAQLTIGQQEEEVNRPYDWYVACLEAGVDEILCYYDAYYLFCDPPLPDLNFTEGIYCYQLRTAIHYNKIFEILRDTGH